MMMNEPLRFAGLRGTLARNASLAKHTSWRTGGVAAILYRPADRDDLARFVRELPVGTPLTVMGLGSNTLVRDGGVRGAVVVMHDPGAALAVADGLVYVDAGVACPKLARFAALHGCGEAEAGAAAINAQVVSNDQMAVRELPDALQNVILQLNVGQATPPFGSLQPGDGVRVLMLCGRDDPQTEGGPDRDQLASDVEEDRVNKRWQRYLRDLRRDAVIEYH